MLKNNNTPEEINLVELDAIPEFHTQMWVSVENYKNTMDDFTKRINGYVMDDKKFKKLTPIQKRDTANVIGKLRNNINQVYVWSHRELDLDFSAWKNKNLETLDNCYQKISQTIKLAVVQMGANKKEKVR